MARGRRHQRTKRAASPVRKVRRSRSGSVEKLVKSTDKEFARLRKALDRYSDTVKLRLKRMKRTNEAAAHRDGVPYVRDVTCVMVLWFTGKMLRDTHERSGNASLLAREVGCRLEDVERTFRGVVRSGDSNQIYNACCSISFSSLEAKAKHCAALFDRHPSLISVLTDQYRVLQYRDLILKEISRTL